MSLYVKDPLGDMCPVAVVQLASHLSANVLGENLESQVVMRGRVGLMNLDGGGGVGKYVPARGM